MSDNEKPITINGVEIPHPNHLRRTVRDLDMALSFATFPLPEWEAIRNKAAAMIPLARVVHEGTEE